MKDNTLIHHFLEQAAQHPDRIALVHNNRRITYARLAENAGRLAAHLRREYRLEPEGLVGVLGTRSFESITAMLGILQAGGSYVPLPVDWPRARISALIREAGLQCVFNDGTSPYMQVGVSLLSVVHLLLEEKQCLTGADLAAEDRLAYVIYTSGSTGVPKGAMIEHRNVLAMLDGFEQVAPHTDPLVGSALVSIGFDVSVWEIFSVLCYGGTLHLIDHPEQVPELAAYYCQQGITSAYLPPLILDDFIHEVYSQKRPAVLNRLLVGVEPIPQQTLADFQRAVPRLRIVNGYGPTETTICATFFPFEGTREPQRRTPIGKAVAGNQVFLVDNQLREVRPGEEGELLICGAGVGRGYYRDARLTDEKFISNPFKENGGRCFRSGDFARALPDGNLEFIGRRDQQIKLSGYRIELGEIGSALMRCPGVKRALALLAEPQAGSRSLAAFYTSLDGKPLDPSELKSFLCSELPVYMLPRAIIHLEEFPLTSNGKIDRRRLQERLLDESTEKTEPLSNFETALLRIFHEVMENDAFGMEANFFDLGGNSLQAARILACLKEQFGIGVSFSEFYDFASVGKMAQTLEGRQYETSDTQIDIPACAQIERIPLTFIQKRTWFIVQSEPDNPSTHSPFALRFRGPGPAAKKFGDYDRAQ
jgi:amino acid adenylation domain-containing protein